MLLMLLSWQDPLFISKTSYIHFTHVVNIIQQHRDQVSGFLSLGLEKCKIVQIKWPWLFGQHPHSRHCLSSPAWGRNGVEWLYGREEDSLGKKLAAQQVLFIADSYQCVLHNWQVGGGGLHKVVSFANTKHSLETAEAAVIQDWYAQLGLRVLQSRMQSNRLDWGTKQRGAEESKAQHHLSAATRQEKCKPGLAAHCWCFLRLWWGQWDDATLQKHH